MVSTRSISQFITLFYCCQLHSITTAEHVFGRKEHFVDFSTVDDLKDSPNTEQYRYIIPGDLTIGAILPIHRRSSIGRACGVGLRETGVVQYVEALVYAIKQINSDPTLLPGYSLGTVVLDDCGTAETALGQALHFMPMQATQQHQLEEEEEDGRHANKPHHPSSKQQEKFTFYDVVGVIGSEGSDASMMIANVLGLFHIPQVSSWATSDLLSDKARYPYFMRTVPPDRFQVEAILQLIRHFNWTYISAVYSKGGYGEEAFLQLGHLLEEDTNICMGKAISVSPDDDAWVYKKAIQTLYDIKVMVVVLLTDQEEARAILKAAKNAKLAGHFVWIGSDGLGINLDDFDGLEEIALGSLVLLSYSVPVAGFQDYFEHLQPGKTTNPWFNEMWQDLFKCYPESDEKFEDVCPMNNHMKDSSDYAPEAYASTIIDTVYVFASALDKLIRERCPRIDSKNVRGCIRGDILLDYLHNITLPGHNGIITFDENGDMLGKYEIHNFQATGSGYKSKEVGIWDSSTGILHINESDIIWNVKRKKPKLGIKNPNPNGKPNTTNSTHLGGRSRVFSSKVPTARCGSACTSGQIYSYFRDTCCWECRTCNVNEISTSNATKCSSCPVYTWPSANKTHCIDLVPNYVQWDEPVAIVFVIVAILGITTCVLIFGVFIKHNDNRLIKATSRELSYLLLAGLTLQYSMMVSIVAMPTDFVCNYNYVGFNISFSVVYAALLTRTNRIFRIFDSGRRTKISPTFTSPTSQIIIAVGLISIQLLINVVVLVSSPPSVTLRMPISTRPAVDLTCGLPVHGFITSLAYNLLLVATCTYYAFRTRALPDNFNESRYITLCVYTTLVIWLVFLPSFFTNSYAFYQTILLGCALVLNATVILFCLFFPKCYAVLVMVKRETSRADGSIFNGVGTIGTGFHAKYTTPRHGHHSCQHHNSHCMKSSSVLIAADVDLCRTAMEAPQPQRDRKSSASQPLAQRTRNVSITESQQRAPSVSDSQTQSTHKSSDSQSNSASSESATRNIFVAPQNSVRTKSEDAGGITCTELAELMTTTNGLSNASFSQITRDSLSQSSSSVCSSKQSLSASVSV